MKCIKFPGYLYQNTTQIGNYSFNLLMDTDLVEQFASYSGQGSVLVQDYQSLNASNVAEIVNKYFGHAVLNTNNHLHVGLSSGDVIPGWWSSCTDMLNLYTDTFVMSRPSVTDSYPNQSVKLMNNCTAGGGAGYVGYHGDPLYSYICYSTKISEQSSYISYDSRFGEFFIDIYREDLFKEDGTLSDISSEAHHKITIRVFINFDSGFETVNRIRIYVEYLPSDTSIDYAFSPKLNLNDAQTTENDPDDPFQNLGGDGNDGGDGEFPTPENNPVDVPSLPSASAASCGLITMYIPTLAQLQSLGNFLWSNLFDPDSFKKLFTDPMQAIVGLAIVPAVPSAGGSKNIKFGNVDSGVSSSFLSTQYVTKNFGSVKIKKDAGSFLDYTDTKISIYLPYLGFRTLSPDDVMGATLSVTYNIDVLTGACAAFIKSSARGVMYAYNGSCITNVPVTGQNFSGAIQNAVSTVASGAGVIAGMATGAAPVTALSAVSMFKSAANCALNSKPEIQRSGNLGGSAGILSVQKPFLIIQRPNVDVPSNLNKFVGNVTFKALSLGACSGFTMVDQVHLDGFAATASEKSEIESLLKAGVIL